MNEMCEKWGLSPDKLPEHVGIIMDGNGRWATRRRLPRMAGHRKGVERVREITESAGKIGIHSLTLFAFSDENWRRPEEEVSSLMGLLRWYMRAERQRILNNDVQFRVIGDRRKLSSDILEQIESLERDTRENRGMCLNIALSYGGRGEMIRAFQRVMQRVEKGEIFKNDIDEATISAHLDTVGLPELDMFIRTSGEMRVSNFLLWQMAYAELFFENVLWPDFDTSVFVSLLKAFAGRERRFGMTSEQIKGQDVRLAKKAQR